MEAEESFKSTLIDCITQQLSEIQLLTCMYPNTNDIILTDSNALQNMKDFLDKKTQFTPMNLDFTLSILIDNLKLEISINLPNFYPKEEPDVYVRCNQLNRQQETALNSDLSIYLRNSHNGEQCLHTVISWISENIERYNTKFSVPPTIDIVINSRDNENKFQRLWIYSHHIYNKKKREEILKRANEYNLTGFCLPGKPGIICIEGFADECNEWWKIIKSMTWKKIGIRKLEIFELSNRNKEQRFKKFEEIHFQNPSSKRSKHADMSEFSKYIEKVGLAPAFNDFFGLCNNNN